MWCVRNSKLIVSAPVTRWRHQMETFSALLAICAGNSPVTGEFPAQRSVTRSFDVFFTCAWTNGWINNQDAGNLRRHRTHYYVTVMINAFGQHPIETFSMRLWIYALSARIKCCSKGNNKWWLALDSREGIRHDFIFHTTDVRRRCSY